MLSNSKIQPEFDLHIHKHAKKTIYVWNWKVHLPNTVLHFHVNIWFYVSVPDVDVNTCDKCLVLTAWHVLTHGAYLLLSYTPLVNLIQQANWKPLTMKAADQKLHFCRKNNIFVEYLLIYYFLKLGKLNLFLILGTFQLSCCATCFRLIKGGILYFDPKQMLRILCIWWCEIPKLS